MPKITVGLWVVLVLILLYCMTLLFSATYQTHEGFQEYEINIERINLWDSHNTKGSRIKLEVIDGKTTYYVWYPQSEYVKFAHDVENDLLTGNVTSVYIKVAKTQSIRDSLFNQKRVVEIKSNETVYYGLDTEAINAQNNQVGLWLLCVLVLVFLICYTILVLLVYRVLVFAKKK